MRGGGGWRGVEKEAHRGKDPRPDPDRNPTRHGSYTVSLWEHERRAGLVKEHILLEEDGASHDGAGPGHRRAAGLISDRQRSLSSVSLEEVAV